MTVSAVVFAWLFIHLGVILVAASYFTVGAAVLPNMTERARNRFARAAWLPAVLGIVVSIPWVGAGVVLLNLPNGALKFAGATLLGFWFLFGLLGSAGLAQHIGRVGDAESATWKATFRGGVFLALTWALPVVGWIAMMPMTLAAGVGSLMLNAIPARSQPVAVVPVA